MSKNTFNRQQVIQKRSFSFSQYWKKICTAGILTSYADNYNHKQGKKIGAWKKKRHVK